MEGRQHRGRSPSAGQISNVNIRHSPSPHHFQDQTSSGEPNNPATSSAFTSQSYNTNLSPTTGDGIQYTLPPSFFEGSAQPQQYQHALPSSDFSDSSFGQSFQQNDLGSQIQHEQSQMNAQQSDPQFDADILNANPNFGDFPQQQDFTSKQGQFHNGFMLDPQLQTGMHQQERSINPADIMSNMSSPPNIPTPPSLMPPTAQSSEPTSPFTNSNQQWSPHHSRHTSLDPSAAYTNGQQPDWSGMLQGSQFQGHRRAPSEHSDVSSSVAPSPYLTQDEAFDSYDQNTSPSLIPQSDQQLYKDGLGIETFSLSDPQQQGNSPRHSPFPSPRMSPQPGLGMALENTFMPLPEISHSFTGVSSSEMYNQTEAFPQFPPEQRLGSNDYGQADHFPPPEINVEYVPTVRQSGFEPPRFENDLDALSPPDRGRRGRIRAKSDTSISRPVTPNSNHSTLGSTDSSIDQRNRSLSPYNGSRFSPNISREPSPAPRSSSQRRSSTNSIPNRDYILELADPSRPQAAGTERMRVQKHPATFQCTLCPKKFTRAYNLRSHLRTHTDERPFVCTVCTKAFARQHDRKRHEGLHSGEKKFVCRGELGTGGSWGCGRRFARADALGRHFRSEAGRICIKPLLDEEAMERQRSLDEQMMNQQPQAAGGGMAPSAPVNGMNGMQQNGFALPAALLLQYPALQGIQWDQMPPGGPGDDEELSGRSSFDASSGGDFYDDDGGSGYVSDTPMHPGYETGGAWPSGQGVEE